jgi:hypothetical protein
MIYSARFKYINAYYFKRPEEIIVPDPHVFGPPGSGAKKVRNTIPTVLWHLLDLLSLKMITVPSKSNKQKKLLKNSFLLVLLVKDENSRIRISRKNVLKKFVFVGFVGQGRK